MVKKRKKKTNNKKKFFKKDYGTGIKAGLIMGLVTGLIISAIMGFAFLSITEADFQTYMNDSIEANSYRYTTEQITFLQGINMHTVVLMAMIAIVIMLGLAGLIYGVLFVALINKIPGKKIYVKSIVFRIMFFILFNLGAVFSFRIFSLWKAFLQTIFLSLVFGYFYIRFGKIKESMKDIKSFKDMF